MVGDAIPDEEIVVGEVHHVAKDVFIGPGGIEHGIAVEVFGVEHAVALGAPAAQVSPWEVRTALVSTRSQSGPPPTGPCPTSSISSGRSPSMPMSSTFGVEDADLGALGVEAPVPSTGARKRRCRRRLPRSCPARQPARLRSRYRGRVPGAGRRNRPDCRPAETPRTRESRRGSRSRPVELRLVTIERHRGWKSRRGRDQREELFFCTMPPAVSAWSVR